MSVSSMVLCIIKLIVGGAATFLAILVWSKTRDGAWMSVLGGVIISYAGTIYQVLLDLRIVYIDKVQLFGLPLTSLIFSIVPQALFITAFIIMLKRKK